MLRDILEEKMSLTDFLEHLEIPAYIVDEHKNIAFGIKQPQNSPVTPKIG
ncbi:hypothetical protein ACSFC1_03950 [Pseudothermotoga sp. U03pept]